ncbi:LysR family transcriptional regulator [Sulfitobacter sp. S190]|uniref:LysR family transcriptional regulator n=1 Tax=Sulfitobacter sp. S190 TaxID=2867022 RepID=UPI0021A569E8|nr:LysR family transcriptional regulator [Sulfitobacter sp. S190]UWR21720.1 LysR family transcriptional regulator [Sulfitobacter sp. S190]
MDKIDRMRAFAAVAREASFTGAGKRLNKSTRLISKYVADLEASLGVQLLHRTTRSVSLTDVGATYLAQCLPLLDGFDELEETVRTAQTALKGQIRIAAPTGFGALRVAPSLATFSQLHPEVDIDLQLSDRRVSIIDEAIDLAVRIGPLRDSTLVARRLGGMPLICCAAPAYLARAGTPAHPHALATHACVRDGNTSDPANWHFRIEEEDVTVRVGGRLRSNAPAASVRIAMAGAAIAMCPAYAVWEALEAGELVELFKPYRAPPYTVAALYPPNRMLTTRVRSLLDHLASDRLIEPAWS